MTESKWVWFRFDGTTPSEKTKYFAVMMKGGPHGYDESLGVIKWHGPWRKYVFDPHVMTIYEQDCLRDIAAFLDELMQGRKKIGAGFDQEPLLMYSGTGTTWKRPPPLLETEK